MIPSWHVIGSRPRLPSLGLALTLVVQGCGRDARDPAPHRTAVRASAPGAAPASAPVPARRGPPVSASAAPVPARPGAPVSASAAPRRANPTHEASPRPASPPPLPELTRGLVSLPVAGHRPAAFVSPTRQDAPPWPVVLILHGNFDRPEWECEWWAASAAPVGWLLCPRGLPRTDVPRTYDRWTYAGSAPAVRETHAALEALSGRHPRLLREDDALYVGFSLGAILAAPVMLGCRLRFTAAALVEGGDAIDSSQMRALSKRGLGRVAYLCGQHTGCAGRVRGARGAVGRWERAGVKARVWVMPGAGHGYSDDFDPLGREVVAWLRERKPATPPPPREAREIAPGPLGRLK